MQKLRENQKAMWLGAYQERTKHGLSPEDAADYADRLVAIADKRGVFDDAIVEKRAADYAHPLAGKVSAVGDVVKVPPHWHVRLQVPASSSGGAISTAFVGEGDKVIIGVQDGTPQVTRVSQYAYECDGWILFDVITTARVGVGHNAEIYNPRPGVSALATVIAVH